MISKKRNGVKNILRTSTKLGQATALASGSARSRRNFPHQPESLLSMIKSGKLGIFRLMSQPGRSPEVDLPFVKKTGGEKRDSATSNPVRDRHSPSPQDPSLPKFEFDRDNYETRNQLYGWKPQLIQILMDSED